MVDRKRAAVDLLQVVTDVSQAEVEALQGLELVVNTGGEGADGDIADVSEEVLNTDLFGLFGLDDRWGVNKRLGRGGSILRATGNVSTSGGDAVTLLLTSLISSMAK